LFAVVLLLGSQAPLVLAGEWTGFTIEIK
jgi:hypothetical protein